MATETGWAEPVEHLCREEREKLESINRSLDSALMSQGKGQNVQWCSINISAMQYQPMNIHISSSNQQEEEEEAAPV